MALELATAYISLIPTTKGFTSGVDKILGSVNKTAASTGQSAGSKLASSMHSALTVGAVAVGGAAVAGIGTAIVKGFSRLNSLDQATAKLKGLGHSATAVQGIMDNALASVKGTAFGLDEASTVAASAVASGIKPGKDLTGVLKTIADTATIAGASMGDTGAIFNSVAARGKLQGDDLMQLQSRGVPVLQFLAKHYGITAQAASQMVSDGKVDFANFNAAMSENLGGAALKSGDTFQGSMDNVGASIGRIGANLLSGLFPAAKTGLGGLLKFLEPVEPAAKSVGTAIGGVINYLKNNQGVLIGIGVAVGAVVSAMLIWKTVMLAMAVVAKVQVAWTVASTAAMWLFNAAMSANPIMLIVLAIAALVAGLIWFFTQTELGKEIWANVSAFFITTWQAIADFFVGLWNGIVAVVTAVWNFIVLVITTYINLVVAIITAVVNTIVAVWTNTWNFVSSVVSTVWGAIVGFVTFYINTVMGIIQEVGSTIAAVWSGIWNGIVGFFTGAWNQIIGVVNTIGGAFGSAFGAISGIVSGAFNGIVGVIRGAINSVIDLVNGAIGAVNDTVGVAGKAIGLDIHIGKIPRLADGGIVTARSGGILANIGEGRYDEAVLPLSPKVLNGLAGENNNTGGTFTGNLYLEGGGLLGVVKGELSKYDRTNEMTTVGGLR